ncbi:MAG: AI-2E family transporter [Azoarcus sp.]|jgi:predicted PurR-regulated permease PerM|nr:AI-2E family transporter [Azoarcus sp.]
MPSTHVLRPQTAFWIGVALALVGLLWLLAPILAPFAIATVFAYLCNPAVDALVRRRLPRPVAVLLVMGVAGHVIVALVLVPLPMLYREALTLAQRLPGLIDLFNQQVAPLLAEQFRMEIRLDASQLQSWIGQFRDSAQDLLPTLLKHIGHSGMAIAGVLANLILAPIVTFYLLQEWPRLIAGLERALPRPWLPRTLRVVSEIDGVLAQFCRGQLSVMLLLAMYYSLGLWLAGLDFALPVGVLTGLLVFIPYVGFLGGLTLAVFAALLQGGGWEPLIGVAVVYGLGQLIESFVLTPYLVGERIGLHPLAVIFAVMAFGQLFGFVGVLIALPVSAALLVGIREVASAWLSSPVYLGHENGTAPPGGDAAEGVERTEERANEGENERARGAADSAGEQA